MITSIDDIKTPSALSVESPLKSDDSSRSSSSSTAAANVSRPVRTNCANQAVRSGYVVPPSYDKWYLSKNCHSSGDVSSWIYDVKYLSLSGGGTKGYAYLGALLSLDRSFFNRKRNLYSQLEGVSGTSIGAVFALFVVLGLRGYQLAKEVCNSNIADSMKQFNIQNLIDMYGLCSTTMFQKIIFDVLERNVGKGDVTFQELFDITRKHYVCTLSNVNTGRPEYHSHLSTPNYKIYESVTASMCVPLLFAPCIINNQCYVDGGLSDNCPFAVFPIRETFIINLSNAHDSDSHVDISSLQLYILRIIMNVCEMFDVRLFDRIPQSERKRVLKIQFRDLVPYDLSIDPHTKKKLAKLGASAVEKFLHPDSANHEAIKTCVKLMILFVMGGLLNN